MTSGKLSDTLKDVVAFVDVWSSSRTENYSKPFIQQLQEMGAEVSKTFDKQVTHVVFKNGHQSTWNKAKKTGVKLVSVLWVARCKDCGEHINEESCPAINEGNHRNPALNKRTHRCMQPRDIPQQTPENNKSMKRKLDRMMKSLTVSSPSSPDTSPFLIDEASGVIYSPASRRANDMALRLKVMREKRESLSRTDSCDEDDSSDLDASFNTLRSSSTGNKCEGDIGKTSTFDLGAARSNVEIDGSAAAFPSRTDTEKQASANHPAKTNTVEFPRGTEPQALSSIQSNALECQTSFESPPVAVLFGGSAVAESPVELPPIRNVRKRRKSSFICDRAEQVSSPSPFAMELSGAGGSENRYPVMTQLTENDPPTQTRASVAHGLSRDRGRSVSLPTSVSESLIRKAAVVRKRDRCREERASPLEAFFRRKSASLAADAWGSPELPRVSAPPDDAAFENYFSPTNRAENGGRRSSLLSSLASEPSPLPPIEEEPKQPKRKRGRSEAGSRSPARGKRRASLFNGT